MIEEGRKPTDFTCPVCEFQSPDRAVVVDHIRREHALTPVVDVAGLWRQIVAERGSNWARIEERIEQMMMEYPDLEAFFAPMLEVALTLKDTPGEDATAREVRAWQSDLIQAARMVGETVRAFVQTLADQGRGLPDEELQTMEDLLEPFDHIAALPPESLPIEKAKTPFAAFLADLYGGEV